MHYLSPLTRGLSEKNVTKVAVVVPGANLGSCHAVRTVDVLDDVRGLEGPHFLFDSGVIIDNADHVSAPGMKQRMCGSSVI
ncbi:hypothetical protein SAMN05216338_105039 [Bradyrhizobium sp. Rc2d]|nr:hypothetical protein SAMN05216338_105039 [Bradyrhizobium sp. Rc2d]